MLWGKQKELKIKHILNLWIHYNTRYSPCHSENYGLHDAFSLPHIVAYSMILMIEMNICFKYGAIFWKTSCLSINSGLSGESTTGTDYSAIAKAVGDLKGTIMNPDINKSELGFTPFEEQGKILFGLKPIIGLGIDNIEHIMAHRPFSDFNDYFRRIFENGLISAKKTITLIKSGCFDSFEPNRRQLMINFVRMSIDKKEKLTMSNFPSVRHLLEETAENSKLCNLYDFRNKVVGRNKIPMNDEIQDEFISLYMNDVESSFENGKLVIDDKSLNKYYNKQMEPIKEWLKTEPIVNEFNKTSMQEYWKLECAGNVQSWEIETVLFYSDKHELDLMPIEDSFNVIDFYDLPATPVATSYKFYKENKYPQYDVHCIAGTVVEKNKNASLISILTKNGIVTVRIYKNKYSYYDKKVTDTSGKDTIVVDSSWFDRGTKLVFIGYRRGREFILRNKGSNYNHDMYKISAYNSEAIALQTEKIDMEKDFY